MSFPPDWYAPGHVPVPRPRPGDDDLPVVWTLRKDTRRIEAVCRFDAGYLGAEATLRRNGELLRSQRFATPDEAPCVGWMRDAPTSNSAGGPLSGRNGIARPHARWLVGAARRQDEPRATRGAAR